MNCLKCAYKHLAQAQIIYLEYLKGHDDHLSRLIGHLGEAEDHLVATHPDLADRVRQIRHGIVEKKMVALVYLDDIEKTIITLEELIFGEKI